MKQAVIVSTARTGLAKSVRGGFNQTHGAVTKDFIRIAGKPAEGGLSPPAR